jgi:hypothetical protein
MQSQGSVPQRRRSSPAVAGKSCPGTVLETIEAAKTLLGVLRPASSNYFYYSRRSFGEESHMNWFYWNTAWSLFFSLVWFMTITHNPEARISDAHLRDEAFGG